MSTLTHPSSTLPAPVALAALATRATPVPERLDAGLRRVLATRIAAQAPGRHLGPVRLDSFRVLRAEPTRQRPFSWSPRTARRLIGLAAARRVADGRAPSPLAAVQAEIDDVVERAATAHARPGALGAWLSEAPAGLRAAAIAEAVSYATDVVTLLDLSELSGRVEVGSPDRVWAVPGAPWVSLRARRDLEISLEPAQRTRALVALRPGRPGADAVDDLGVVALADALSRPEAPLPTRVVGVWPSCGRSVSLEVEAETMRRAARLVVARVDALGRSSGVGLAA